MNGGSTGPGATEDRFSVALRPRTQQSTSRSIAIAGHSDSRGRHPKSDRHRTISFATAVVTLSGNPEERKISAEHVGTRSRPEMRTRDSPVSPQDDPRHPGSVGESSQDEPLRTERFLDRNRHFEPATCSASTAYRPTISFLNLATDRIHTSSKLRICVSALLSVINSSQKP